MQFSILGALQVTRADGPVDVRGRKPRALLALLLADTNQFVSKDVLADALWEGSPPRGAATTLRGHVLTIRRALGDDDGDAARLTTGTGGYRLRVDEGELDAHRFEALVERGRAERAEGHHDRAVATLRQALGLWRGRPFGDIDLLALEQRVVPRLEAQRLAATHEYMESSLEAGKHEEIVPQLRELVADHPLHEGFCAQLMLALHRSGRQGEALQVYGDVRKRLVDETGLEPSVTLRELQASLLRGDPARATVETAQPPPCELPPVVPDFVGRAEMLAQAERHVVAGRPDARAHARTVVLSGPPGVGTSSVAVELAHRCKDAFPDGQLYVPFTDAPAGDESIVLRRAVARSLEALGERHMDAATSWSDLQRCYRRLTANRRLLLLLDGVPSPSMLHALLPSSPVSVAIVTATPAWVPASDGVCHLPVVPFTTEQAITLLRGTLGRGPVDVAGEAAARIAVLCDGLPLALRAAARWIAARGADAAAVRALATRMEDDDRRLSALAIGDPAMERKVAQAVGQCSATARRVLAWMAGAGAVTPDDVAAAVGLDPDGAEDAVHQLCRFGLCRAARGAFDATFLARSFVTCNPVALSGLVHAPMQESVVTTGTQPW